MNFLEWLGFVSKREYEEAEAKIKWLEARLKENESKIVKLEAEKEEWLKLLGDIKDPDAHTQTTSRKYDYGYGEPSPKFYTKGMNGILRPKSYRRHGQIRKKKTILDINNLSKKVLKNKTGKITSHKLKNRDVIKSKYTKLCEYLINSELMDKTLTYQEIEDILGFKLPQSAYKYYAWWANGGHSHANAWLEAGWRVTLVELGKSVTLQKTSI